MFFAKLSGTLPGLPPPILPKILPEMFQGMLRGFFLTIYYREFASTPSLFPLIISIEITVKTQRLSLDIFPQIFKLLNTIQWISSVVQIALLKDFSDSIDNHSLKKRWYLQAGVYLKFYKSDLF